MKASGSVASPLAIWIMLLAHGRDKLLDKARCADDVDVVEPQHLVGAIVQPTAVRVDRRIVDQNVHVPGEAAGFFSDLPRALVGGQIARHRVDPASVGLQGAGKPLKLRFVQPM
jgi:hypothetical protein